MKKILVLAILSLAVAIPASAAKYATVGVSAANVRSCAGTNCAVKFKVWKYTPLYMSAVSKDRKWVKVSDFEGYEGWISAPLLSTQIGVSATVDVNIRQSASGSAPLACTVEKGYALKYISKKGAWIEVEDDPENPSQGVCRGWVSSAFVWGPRAGVK
ncbi:SH3-like domain-containing protein [Parelusimicrobium proximum]|uniref:SH3 domain-containing protein n=1 Tax=Parelusimicrobium proximum TaxID=3228953 RepID=UPI003D1702E4